MLHKTYNRKIYKNNGTTLCQQALLAKGYVLYQNIPKKDEVKLMRKYIVEDGANAIVFATEVSDVGKQFIIKFIKEGVAENMIGEEKYL